jgi:hypothetical protein
MDKEYGVGSDQGSAKTRIITQYLQQAQTSLIKLAEKVDKDREEKTEEYLKNPKRVVDLVKDDPEAYAKLTEALDIDKKELDKAVRQSKGFLVGREKKKEAGEKITQIQNKYRNYEEDFKRVDEILAQEGTYSQANTVGDSADNSYIYGELSRKDFEYRDDGIYVTQPSTGEKVRLKDYKAPLIKWDNGIEAANTTLVNMGDTKYGTQEWETVSDMVSAQANKLIGDKRFKSLIFDDIGNFSFAKEYLVTTEIPGITQTNEDEVRDELNRLKERYDKDPKFKKEVQEKWKESYTAEAKQRFDDMKERYEEEQEKDPRVPSEIRVQESKDKRRLKINKEAFVDVENEGQGRLADGTYIVKHESGKYYYTSTPSKQLDPENLPRMYELKSMKAANL